MASLEKPMRLAIRVSCAFRVRRDVPSSIDRNDRLCHRVLGIIHRTGLYKALPETNPRYSISMLYQGSCLFAPALGNAWSRI